MTIEDIVLKKYTNGEIWTDSDILDIAEEYQVGARRIYMIISRIKAVGTQCEGCRHIETRFFNSLGFPCKKCSRINQIKDYFEAEEK